jgi:hypothetical protein
MTISSFIQFFNNAVHSRADLALIEKFQYLLSYLSREPLNLVKALTLSEENYRIAYKALVDRYENKRRLSYHYWNNIQALPKLKLESSQGLRETIDKLTENRSALLALNLSHSLEDFMWLQLLLEKLDPETRKQFEAEIRSLGPAEVPKYTQLAEFVESQCRVLDSLGNCKIQFKIVVNYRVVKSQLQIKNKISFAGRLVVSVDKLLRLCRRP